MKLHQVLNPESTWRVNFDKSFRYSSIPLGYEVYANVDGFFLFIAILSSGDVDIEATCKINVRNMNDN